MPRLFARGSDVVPMAMGPRDEYRSSYPDSTTGLRWALAAFGGSALPLLIVEPMTGIEPAYSAWEVGLIRPPLSLSIRLVERPAGKHPCKSIVVSGGRQQL